jgi:hypothetical protein
MLIVVELVIIWLLVSIPLGCCIGTIIEEMGEDE